MADGTNELMVEEYITFKNIGTTNFSGKLFMWANPGIGIGGIHLFELGPVIENVVVILFGFPELVFQ